MNSDAWIKKLQKTDRKILLKYSLADFIKISRKAFLEPDVIEILDQLKKASYINNELLYHFYILAFVYRDTDYFKQLIKGYDISPSLLIYPDYSNENDSNTGETNKEASSIFKTVSSGIVHKNKVQMFADRLSELSRKAEYFNKKIQVIYETYLESKKHQQESAHETIFDKIYRQEMTGKCNVSQLLREATTSSENYDAFRRRYYRWKNDITFFDSKWPTDNFLRFCAFLAIKYTISSTDSYSSQYKFLILNEVPGVEVQQIYRELHSAMRINPYDTLLKAEFDKAKKCECGKEREKLLRKLVLKNYLDAIKEYIGMLAERNQTLYLIRAAVLGDKESQDKLAWKARGFRNFNLEVCAHDRLRVTEISTLPSGEPIRPMTILKSIKFPMVINSEKWSDIYHQFEGRQTTPLENNFFVTYNNLGNQSAIWKTVSIDATSKNFNLLMQNAELLALNQIEICFSSRHNKKLKIKNVELIRDDKISDFIKKSDEEYRKRQNKIKE